MNNTYWSNNRVVDGRNMSELYDLVNDLVPFKGECSKSTPKLERLRKAVNRYYQALNNGNYRGFYAIFGVKGRDYTEFAYNGTSEWARQERETVESKMDQLVMAAAEEAGFLR